MRWLPVIILLAGCSDEPPALHRNTTTVTVIEAPELDTRGRAIWDSEHCTIFLREYPKCLTHEMMHCLSGKWHGNLPNDDYCDHF